MALVISLDLEDGFVDEYVLFLRVFPEMNTSLSLVPMVKEIILNAEEYMKNCLRPTFWTIEEEQVLLSCLSNVNYFVL